jgi:hypothetical protein
VIVARGKAVCKVAMPASVNHRDPNEFVRA